MQFNAVEQRRLKPSSASIRNWTCRARWSLACDEPGRPGLVPVAAEIVPPLHGGPTMTRSKSTVRKAKQPARRAPRRRRPRAAPRTPPVAPRRLNAGRSRSTPSSSRSSACCNDPRAPALPRLCKATGWQTHSVRGALAGALKRKGHGHHLREGRRRPPLRRSPEAGCERRADAATGAL